MFQKLVKSLFSLNDLDISLYSFTLLPYATLNFEIVIGLPI
jgi:hypothetical protein